MKASFFSYLVLAAALVPLPVSAELLIYKGTERDSFVGQGYAARISFKVIVIIDHDTGHFGQLLYGIVNGSKRLETSQITNTHIVQITGSQSKTYTAIARIPNDCDAQERPGKEGVYLKGVNATIPTSSTSTKSFPKTLSDAGVGLSTSPGEPVLAEGSTTLVFNRGETIFSNDTGESFDAAFARLVASVESLGYSQ